MNVKNMLLLLLIMGMMSCDDKEKFELECLPNNLQGCVIAFYPFNNGSLNDGSPNDNHVSNTTSAMPATDRHGNANCAYQFDNLQGNEEFLSTTATDFLNNLNKFSISMWYEPIDTSRGMGVYETLLSRGDAAKCPDRRGEWSLGLYDCRKAVFGHNNSVWVNNVITDPNNNICKEELIALTDTWHHIVAVKNNDTYKIYFNGNLEETQTGNGNCSNLQLAEDIGDMFIGKGYTGKIDDILIYKKALSQSEVSDLYELDACCE